MGYTKKNVFAPFSVQRSAQHWCAIPVQIVLLLFGFSNAGVAFEEIGRGTYYVLIALFAGKPVGILLFSAGARAAELTS